MIASTRREIGSERLASRLLRANLAAANFDALGLTLSAYRQLRDEIEALRRELLDGRIVVVIAPAADAAPASDHDSLTARREQEEQDANYDALSSRERREIEDDARFAGLPDAAATAYLDSDFSRELGTMRDDARDFCDDGEPEDDRSLDSDPYEWDGRARFSVGPDTL